MRADAASGPLCGDEEAIGRRPGARWRRRATRTGEPRSPAMVSNTGWTSVGELQMTRRISLVAVCCSSVSVRSRLRVSSSCEQADVLDRDHRLVGEGLEQVDLLAR